jgi:hypothetical protein
LHGGVVDGRLVAGDGCLQLVHQRLLLVEGLLRHAVVAAQQLVALEVDPRHLQLRLGLAKLGTGLVEAGADRPVIEGGQQVALLHHCPSFTSTWVSTPSTCGRTSTLCSDSTEPMAPR